MIIFFIVSYMHAYERKISSEAIQYEWIYLYFYKIVTQFLHITFYIIFSVSKIPKDINHNIAAGDMQRGTLKL